MATRRPRPLIASCRLQLTPTFGFEHARSLIDPIARLGISHLYLSPIAEAVTGSEHGYDVVDPRAVRADFGGESGLEMLLDASAERDLGVIIDHVPNHVSVARAELNPWWWEVLRDGPESGAADWFDIDWEATDGHIIVPKLGDPLVDVVAGGGLEVGDGERGPELRYGPLRFPIAAGTADLPLPELLAAQHYSLTWWRDPARNVRRFFTIDDLVAVRVENDGVRSIIDSLPQRLTSHTAFDGVRVDHVDGLADPGRYLEQLRSTIGERWLLVEKILGPGETLPAAWPVDGTTGYEHITASEHLLLDDAAMSILDAFWGEVVASGDRPVDPSFAAIEDVARREVLDRGLRPDLDRLVRTTVAEGLVTGSEDGVGDQDQVRDAIIELTVRLHRYRTYLPSDPASHDVLSDLVERTNAACPNLADTIGWFVALLGRSDAVRTRWQQLTGPAMAKGAEDRAFYRYQRLSSLCEVGGEPGRWSIGVDEFHRHQQSVQEGWPTTMLTSTTHDTKRSSGVRARSLALATIGESFVAEARRWMNDNPSSESVRASDVSLAVQTALTSWPVNVERLTAYLVKSARESEQDTSWTDSNADYERALADLSDRLVVDMSDPSSRLTALGRRLVAPGSVIGLRMKVLQMTCPGVPDLYQGAPFELLSLVDPDNRRPPDWERWRAVLDDAPRVVIADAIAGGDVDRARTAVVHRLLGLRRRRSASFGPRAGYRPVKLDGPAQDLVVAYQRFDSSAVGDGRDEVLVLVLRPTTSNVDLASTTIDLGDEPCVNVLGDAAAALAGRVSVAALLGDAGVAVLERNV